MKTAMSCMFCSSLRWSRLSLAADSTNTTDSHPSRRRRALTNRPHRAATRSQSAHQEQWVNGFRRNQNTRRLKTPGSNYRCSVIISQFNIFPRLDVLSRPLRHSVGACRHHGRPAGHRRRSRAFSGCVSSCRCGPVG